MYILVNITNDTVIGLKPQIARTKSFVISLTLKISISFDNKSHAITNAIILTTIPIHFEKSLGTMEHAVCRMS